MTAGAPASSPNRTPSFRAAGLMCRQSTMLSRIGAPVFTDWKHQIIRSIRLHRLIPLQCSARTNDYLDRLELLNSLDNTSVVT